MIQITRRKYNTLIEKSNDKGIVTKNVTLDKKEDITKVIKEVMKNRGFSYNQYKELMDMANKFKVNKITIKDK